MSANRSSISQAQSYQEIGDFWGTHDVTDYWEETEPVEFEVDIQSEVRYCALERTLVKQVSKIARQRGVSVETLVISEPLGTRKSQGGTGIGFGSRTKFILHPPSLHSLVSILAGETRRR